MGPGREALWRNCDECKASGLQKERGCEEESSLVAFPHAPSLRRCPVAYLDESAWAYVQWWCDWREFRALPWPGDMLDQPNVVYQAISHCESAVKRIEINSHREQEQALARAREHSQWLAMRR